MHKNCTISVLCEDQARMGFRDRPFRAQHGLSLFIQTDTNIIFDTGPSGTLIHNAELLGMDLDSADWIVLSHGHWDHSDGLAALHARGLGKRLLLHPEAFADRHKPTGEYNGIFCKKDELAEWFDLVESQKPYRVSESVTFLGEIPRLNDFEARETPFYRNVDGQRLPDFLMDDSALAMYTASGPVLVAGCSHAGICNICEYAKKTLNTDRLHAVLGGFHLLKDDRQLSETIAYFKENRVDRLYPMHCVSLPAFSRFHQEFSVDRLCAGDVIQF